MAWNEIKKVCGHEERIQLYGKTSERERRARWEAEKMCEACYRAKVAVIRDVTRALATARAQADGLPPLIVRCICGQLTARAYALTHAGLCSQCAEAAERNEPYTPSAMDFDAYGDRS